MSQIFGQRNLVTKCHHVTDDPFSVNGRPSASIKPSYNVHVFSKPFLHHGLSMDECHTVLRDQTNVIMLQGLLIDANLRVRITTRPFLHFVSVT